MASGGTESGDFCRPRLADVNEADGQELRELRFKVGDALPADDPLARFVLVVSMGLNDNSLSNTRFVNTKEPYELLYFFRLASGHLHELAKRLRRAQAAAQAVDVVLAVLRGYSLESDDAIHATRIIRASLHGFVSLEASKGFGLPLDVDETFTRLTQLLDQGLIALAPVAQP